MPMQRIFSGARIGGSNSTSASGKSARTPVIAGLTSCNAPARSRSSSVVVAHPEPQPQVDDALTIDNAESWSSHGP